MLRPHAAEHRSRGHFRTPVFADRDGSVGAWKRMCGNH